MNTASPAGAVPFAATSERPMSMPLNAPLFSVGTEVSSVQWWTLEFRTSPAAIAAALPAPLSPSSAGGAAFWIARFGDTRFEVDGAVRERRPTYWQAGLCARSHGLSGSGGFAVQAFIDGGPNAGIMGRELMGMPKKQANRVRVTIGPDRHRIELHNAVDEVLIDLDVPMRDAVSHDAPLPRWMTVHRTLKAIPSAEGTGWDVLKIARTHWRFANATTTAVGSVPDFAWGDSTVDALHRFPPRDGARLTAGAGTLSIGFARYETDLLA